MNPCSNGLSDLKFSLGLFLYKKGENVEKCRMKFTELGVNRSQLEWKENTYER